MNLIKTVIGDWSQDGHNMTETKTFLSNLTALEIQEAYIAGCKKIGGNIADYVSAYEAQTVPLKLVQKIEAAWHERNPGKTFDDFLDATCFDDNCETVGYDGKPLTGEYSPASRSNTFVPEEAYTEFVQVYPDSYFLLYLEVVRIGNPTFIMKNSSDKAKTINIGGYGLFSA